MSFNRKQSAAMKCSVCHHTGSASACEKSTNEQKVLSPRALPLALAVALHGNAAFAELPVPSSNFINGGQGLAVMQSDGVNMVINQQSDRVILNWDQFNVGSGNSVTYNQPSTGSVALNRIFQNDPSKILGAINANGQVYLYNQNGIIFGEGSKINVGSLVATTLNVDDSQFLQGALTNAIENGQAAFFDITGDNKGIIEIQTGAEINANDPNGGRILVIAPEIINGGTLSSPDGQTMLAASSDKVYLAASDKDPNLRGLLVEVVTGGSVTNLGSIIADRGNITMIGLAVNQSGHVRATTSVNKNGSIRLLARDNAVIKNNDSNIQPSDLEVIGIVGGITNKPTASKLAFATHTGSILLGPGSKTEVAPEADVVSAVPDAQEQLQSRVEIVGKEIWLQQDSSIIAASGKVKVTATETPDVPFENQSNSDNSYVYMDAGSLIDVSGTDTTILPMERNSLEVEVRSNELAGSPLQRGGVLQGKTVYVDLSKGADIVDYSGALANVRKTVSERLASGGDIEIKSAGDVVQLDGSVMDISGGTIAYDAGFIKETQLISENRVYDLSQADKNRSYDSILGVETVTHDRWGVTETFTDFSGLDSGRYVASFIEGKDAGTISIAAASTLLAANGVKAETIVGPYQRDTSNLAATGELDINLRALLDKTQDVTILAQSLVDPIIDELANAPDTATLQREAITAALVLPDDYLEKSGLGKLSINTNGAVVIDNGAIVRTTAGASIDLTGSDITMNGSIYAAAGNVGLTAAIASVPSPADRAELRIGEQAVIDTAGLWINEGQLEADISRTTPFLVDGGDIHIDAQGNVVLATGSLLNASGGARFDAEYNVSAGEGGDISIVTHAPSGGSSIELGATLQSYALYKGGELGLETASIVINNDPATVALPDQMLLNDAFFQSGGFSKYKLTANEGNFIVDAVLQPLAKNMEFIRSDVIAVDTEQQISESVLNAATGSSIQSITDIAMLPDYLRQPVDLEFNLRQLEQQADQSRNFTVTENAVINADSRAEIVLNSDTSIYMNGIIDAPAGNVSLSINKSVKEFGFLDNQGVWLASGSRISTVSDFILMPDEQSLRVGEVFDAGTVSLNANRGYVIVQEGASIDVSANTVTLDRMVAQSGQGTQFQPVEVAPDAGVINISAAEGVIIDGDIHAASAYTAGAQGGVLDVSIGVSSRGISASDNSALPFVKFNFNSRDIIIADNLGKILADTVLTGDAIDSSLNGKVFLDAGKIEQAGFDSLKLKTDHVTTNQDAIKAASEIRFESDVQLAMKSSIFLQAPTINANNHNVNLQAASVNIGTDSRTRKTVITTPQAGTGNLSLSAALINVVGDVDVSGINTLSMNASEDVRFIGAPSTPLPDQLHGALNTTANIDITARQLFPATNSHIVVNLINNPTASLTIKGSGGHAPVLSAGGSLTLNAPVIEVGGVVKAPFGNIALNATDEIRLLPDSLLSISAENQIIPYGETRNAGTSWNYDIDSEIISAKLPEKSIELAAPKVDLQEGAIVDLSGGGDVAAWEFVQGPTGKIDVLNTEGVFAVLPDSASQYAPYDRLLGSDVISSGDSVYFAGGNGLDAGFYTILPARYALLPGAKLVTPLTDIKNIYPGKAINRADGAPVVAGKYGIANTDIVDSIWSAFVVEDGSIARTRSEYIETYASAFFTNGLPADAGTMVISATQSLSLEGAIKGDHVAEARGSHLDILADNIEVVADAAGATNGFIQLTDDGLNNLAVDSLMLGGKRRIGDGITTVSVRSNDVVIRENAHIEAPELLLVARNNIETRAGSSLNGTGGSSSYRQEFFTLDNNAAMLGVSVNPLAEVTRSGNEAGASIILASSSTLAADSSMLIDSSLNVDFGATINMDGGGLRLGAEQINLGSVPESVTGFNLNSTTLAGLNVDRLVISSSKSLAIYEDVNLSFKNLELNTSGINGISTSGSDVLLSAVGNIILRQNGREAEKDGKGNGSFTLAAGEIIFAGNNEAFVLDGFDETTFTASQRVTGAGREQAVFDFISANVHIDSPLITGNSGSRFVVNTIGAVELNNSSGIVAGASLVDSLGAQLEIAASSITVDTRVVLPSGLIALNSTGPESQHGVTAGNNAYLDVSGRTINYVDGSQAGTSAGWVSLASANGSVVAAPGSFIDLSSSSVAGDAGYLELLTPQATTTLGGTINTASAAGFDGASIRVDVDHIADTAAFVQTVQAAGFTSSQNYRVRNGDIDINALANGDANIKASEIIMAADNGSVNLTGKLDASGENAGRVEIYASVDVILNGTLIDAFALSGEKGGSVLLATGNGSLSVDSASQINVSGSNYAETGKVTLRAPRTNANSDIAITEFGAIVSGAERIDLEGVTVYNDSTIGLTEQAEYRTDAANWLTNTNAITARLGLDADSRMHFLSGIEVVSSGDINISNVIDFYQWQIDTAGLVDEGTFTVRAGNNLNLNATISDALAMEVIYAYPDFPLYDVYAPVIKDGNSWNYRLVSGADVNAVNPLAYSSDSASDTGNLTLASGVAVRTGEGDINIASGGNLELADQTSVIYTFGKSNTGKYSSAYNDEGTSYESGIPDGPQFPDHGGDITIKVAQDVIAVASNQYFTDWLQRLGGVTALDKVNPIPGTWGIVIKDFEQGVATFGGGDINVTAGGDISNLSISTATTGQIDSNDNVVIRGGGNINVFAGGDYRSARILADGGEASIRVAGDIAAGADGLDTLLVIGDAQVSIEAGGDIDIGGIGNVTMLPLSNKQSNPIFSVDIANNQSYFFTYTERSGVDLISHYGDININDIAAISAAPNNLLLAAVVDDDPFNMWSIYPGDFIATTLTGDIKLGNSFTMIPAADGNLELLAASDIFTSDSGNSNMKISMSDAALSDLPGITDPDKTRVETIALLIDEPLDPTSIHAEDAPVHLNDAEPVLIVANGDIDINNSLKLVLPKKAHIYAGGDIIDLAIDIQNLLPSDKSLFVAGGDISYPIPDANSGFINSGMKITGPGSIEVIAGGNVDLGISVGIRSLGNIDNPVLVEQGSDISIYAGVDGSLDTAAFIATYFNGDTSGDAALIDIDVDGYQQQLFDYIVSDQFGGDISSAVSAVTGEVYTDRQQAIAALNQLSDQQQVDIAVSGFSTSPVAEQRNLLLNILFNEVNQAASEQASTGNDEAYARGFLAIDRLFHSADEALADNTVQPGGDINLPFSRILSASGGDINLLAPGGELIVGYTAEVKKFTESAGATGVVVSGKGNLGAMTEGDISVNLSRMLTLDGGDISLWSSSGDIDAGRGAKSELTIPPPLTIVDKDTGQIKVIFPPAVEGSGIGAASFSLGQAPGKVTLAAPGGVINASDAGIRSDGDLVLAATKVLGADNISAGGTSVGIPVATNVTAGLTGLSSSTDSAMKGATESISGATEDAAASDGVALVTVELLGTGEEQDQ